MGTFATINWAIGTYYLVIKLNIRAGFVAMGTMQLLSVPYALHASNGITTTQAGAITAQVLSNTTLQGLNRRYASPDKLLITNTNIPHWPPNLDDQKLKSRGYINRVC